MSNNRGKGWGGYAKERRQARAKTRASGSGSFCSTGKRVYESRKAARKALRELYPGEKATVMSEYLCFCGAWHIGHTPRDVRDARPSEAA